MSRLMDMPDAEITFSDIPKVTKNSFTNQSGIGDIFKPIKQQITLRLDGDILAWAKQTGTGYQSRINATLRRAMLEDIKSGAA